ncbi:hypothetical protein [Ferroplasma sp.]|uniref:hypothetical protein n=1 Tax=Ferroplasma sp. TaxID=2591003 RepID=UPI00307E5C5B
MKAYKEKMALLLIFLILLTSLLVGFLAKLIFYSIVIAVLSAYPLIPFFSKYYMPYKDARLKVGIYLLLLNLAAFFAPKPLFEFYYPNTELIRSIIAGLISLPVTIIYFIYYIEYKLNKRKMRNKNRIEQ